MDSHFGMHWHFHLECIPMHCNKCTHVSYSTRLQASADFECNKFIRWMKSNFEKKQKKKLENHSILICMRSNSISMIRFDQQIRLSCFVEQKEIALPFKRFFFCTDFDAFCNWNSLNLLLFKAIDQEMMNEFQNAFAINYLSNKLPKNIYTWNRFVATSTVVGWLLWIEHFT